MKKFELIKSTPFSFMNKKGVEQTGVAYTVAYKGRVLQISTLNFIIDEELVATEDELTLKCEFDVVRDSFTNDEDEEVEVLKLLPKWDLGKIM